jgi:hypothetical protein
VKNKIFLKTLTVFLVAFGAFSWLAQVSAKTLDPRCFTKSACYDQWDSKKQAKENNAFYTEGKADTVCPDTLNQKKVGFCRPATRADTEVSFAGKDEFNNIAQFIRYMYDWSMVAGAVLAVLVILGSGIQIAVSGGRSNMIKTAKGRITGALAGIVLLVGSFTILDTINPALTNLRLPQVWLIRQVNAPPQWCSQMEEDKKLALALKRSEKKSKQKERKDKLKPKKSYDMNSSTATCGNRYFMQGSQGLTCMGDDCTNPSSMCVPMVGTIKSDKINKENRGYLPGCMAGRLALVIKPGTGQTLKRYKSRQEALRNVNSALPSTVDFIEYVFSEGYIRKKDWLFAGEEAAGQTGINTIIPVCKTGESSRIQYKNVSKKFIATPGGIDSGFKSKFTLDRTVPSTYIVSFPIKKKKAVDKYCPSSTDPVGFVITMSVEQSGAFDGWKKSTFVVTPENYENKSKEISLEVGPYSKFFAGPEKFNANTAGDVNARALYIKPKYEKNFFSFEMFKDRGKIGRMNFKTDLLQKID